ncbi:MAG TPA: DUF4136 domain-containing protein [Candidatus Margulisiibacteriota bacterium]|nr:DUF4136 domain-containing protein [Candidatus Margulisiibacteriota bacterium]
MRHGSRLLMALFVAALAGCASKPTLRVSAERSAATDFSGYLTYRWASAPPEVSLEHSRTPRELLDWRIRNGIEAQLAARGYQQVQSGKADMIVAYHLDLREAHTESVGDFINYRQSGGQEAMQEAYVFGYQEGTLVIEAVDGATRRLVWRSAAGPLLNPEAQQERVREAVQRMMERFPAR